MSVNTWYEALVYTPVYSEERVAFSLLLGNILRLRQFLPELMSGAVSLLSMSSYHLPEMLTSSESLVTLLYV